MSQKEAKAIQESIRKILFEDWDPIGVNDIAPDDEYDSYVGSVYRVLVSEADADKLSAHLLSLEVTQMHSSTSPEHRKMVADKLLNLNVSLSREQFQRRNKK